MKVTVVGTGYVGLVTGTCLAEIGHQVICVDNNTEKIDKLHKGIIPIYEPGLEDLVRRNTEQNRLFFSIDLPRSINESEIIFIAVGTPSKPNGEADLSYVENVAYEIAKAAKDPKIVVEKSTVPVETGNRLYEILHTQNGHKVKFDVVSNPEFLREGTAVSDFMRPDRIVIGTESESSREKMKRLYDPLKAPIIFTDISSAELIKHASNSFLALKISYANALANICEKTGANIDDVVYGMSLDKRIGPHFLKAGIGYGGSCFPKDVDAFVRIAAAKGISFGLLEEVQSINELQRTNFVEKIQKKFGSLEGKTIAVLGLAFKPDTDDLRSAPALDIIAGLQKAGAKIRVFDPVAMDNANQKLSNVEFTVNEFDCMKGADAVAIMTEWPQFRGLDWKQAKTILKKPILFDGRNLFSLEQMKKIGFEYISVGRKPV
ncbi:MAG: UDP-glucose/GDP-mannose dehydrogenase family protein [Candidatus Diapherotrites archaeon]|uniref:UDP-glucose 6-dehydrogenase n=1 Tax=Candidatus Iainarchaeum sp. TaxID=3101447 RepID=A0A8T4L2A0_9ARCH|nr:UDP-glucose/GDP-mannose dehydrogenase family protein [Candidatus Diapherotrites archaeon]